MTVAVVTVVRGRAEHLRRQRLALADESPDLHVVVGMGEQPVVSGDLPTEVLTVPVTGHALPVAAARNAGATLALQAGADVLVFLDVDCIPGPGCIERYADAAAEEPGLALLCGPVAYLPPAPAGGYPSAGLDRLAPFHPARPAPAPGEVLPETRFDLFWSLSFAVTAVTWSKLGGFCEDYLGYGAEDTDFAAAAEEAGARLLWVGGAAAYHQHHPPSWQDPARAAEIVANATVFHRRHGRWPMAGWLEELARSGAVEFDPARDFLRLRTP